jgi:hypothetical protein
MTDELYSRESVAGGKKSCNLVVPLIPTRIETDELGRVGAYFNTKDVKRFLESYPFDGPDRYDVEGYGTISVSLMREAEDAFGHLSEQEKRSPSSVTNHVSE